MIITNVHGIQRATEHISTMKMNFTTQSVTNSTGRYDWILQQQQTMQKEIKVRKDEDESIN